jgi:hypothetical protein
VLGWLDRNSKPVALVAGLVTLASGVYLLLKYASVTVAAVYSALLVQCAIVLGVYVLYRWAQKREPVESSHDDTQGVPAEASDRRSRDTASAALVLAVRLFGAAAFFTTVLVVGIGYQKQLTIQAAVTAGVWLPFAGALISEIEFLSSRRDGRGHADVFQLLSRMALGSSIVGLAGATVALAVSKAYALLLKSSDASAHNLVVRMALGESRSSESILDLLIIGALITAFGYALIRGIGRNMFVLGWATFFALVGLGRATQLDAGGYGAAEIAVGIAIGLLGTFLHRKWWIPSFVVVLIVVPSAITVAVYAYLHQQLEITASSAIGCLAALSLAVGLFWRRDVSDFQLQPTSRRIWLPSIRPLVWPNWLYLFVDIGLVVLAAFAAVGSHQNFDAHRPGTGAALLGIALALTWIALLARRPHQ